MNKQQIGNKVSTLYEVAKLMGELEARIKFIGEKVEKSGAKFDFDEVDIILRELLIDSNNTKVDIENFEDVVYE